VQQVNLYSAEFRPKKDLLALKNMLAILVAVWLIGAISVGWLQWVISQSNAQMADWEQQNEFLQQEVEALEVQLAARTKDPRLEVAAQKLKLQLNNTQSLLDAIARGMDEGVKREVFADVLLALAKHQLDPLWLQQIQIMTRGDRVVLAGTTLHAEAVPRYLQALGSEKAFSGRIFNEFRLQIDGDDNPRYRQFTVDTQAEADPDKPVEGAKNDSASRIEKTLQLGKFTYERELG